jgi:hypothetical protein
MALWAAIPDPTPWTDLTPWTDDLLRSVVRTIVVGNDLLAEPFVVTQEIRQHSRFVPADCVQSDVHTICPLMDSSQSKGFDRGLPQARRMGSSATAPTPIANRVQVSASREFGLACRTLAITFSFSPLAASRSYTHLAPQRIFRYSLHHLDQGLVCIACRPEHRSSKG